MTRDEALTQYIDALNEEQTPEKKSHVLSALATLKQFMAGGRLPDDLIAQAKGRINA